ncbi:MAG: AAA family ATPase [Pseudomonadota bacterium]
MALPPALAHLLDPAAYPHPVAAVRLIETHISWVLLAGDYAYKIKRPVDFGFLDFSSLDKRHACCVEEIRLNQRLAPSTYLDVVPVTRSGLRGHGDVLDWAVRMRAFPAEATLDRATRLTAAQIDAIAERIADFHRALPPCPADCPYGSPEAVIGPALDNFRQISALLPRLGAAPDHAARLAALAAWTQARHERLHAHFAARKRDGFVRECHGDLHLGNIAWLSTPSGDGEPLIFDCLEFNPDLRHIDVISELAFLAMDLHAHDRPDLAWRLLDRYLTRTGDFAGLAAYRDYAVYRALVRTKVAALRADQGDTGARADVARYLQLAEHLADPGPTGLILMHGPSGSGKSWLSERLLEALGAIRLRSDVERKRLFGLEALSDSRALGDIYTPEASRRVFAHLGDLAGHLLDAGFRVIVDATFLGCAHRHTFAALAEAHGQPWRLVSLQLPEAVLRTRVENRQAHGGDASEAGLAVLDSQLQAADALEGAELAHTTLVSLQEPPETTATRLRAWLSG